MITRARIPHEYVMVSGAGQSNFGPGIDPWETTSYDIALQQAGIGNFNIVKYSSVIPPSAVKITLARAEELGYLQHGMVLESIMAQMNGKRGEHICAGVGTMQICKGKKWIGGFAAEYEGHLREEEAKKVLRQSLQGIFDRRYNLSPYSMQEEYVIKYMEFCLKSLFIVDDFGTVISGLGFVSFLSPGVCGCKPGE